MTIRIASNPLVAKITHFTISTKFDYLSWYPAYEPAPEVAYGVTPEAAPHVAY